ncbi:hypothetical protein A2U01_0032245, partial [Trifolium medium]|nr:hypothetical protein [Trifolium medium]
GCCSYVESTILVPVKEKVVCAWTNSVMHLGNTTTNRVESTHARTAFGLPCTCELVNIVMERKPISLDIIHSHWKRQSLEDADLIQKGRPSLSLLPEWEAIQV